MNTEGQQINTHDDSGVTWRLPEELVELGRETGMGMLTELLTIFEEDTAERLKALRAAIQKDDHAEIRRQAHSLKGGALQIGANRFAGYCREMEGMAQQAGKPEHLALLVRIEDEFIRVKEKLSASVLEMTQASQGIRL